MRLPIESVSIVMALDLVSLTGFRDVLALFLQDMPTKYDHEDLRLVLFDELKGRLNPFVGRHHEYLTEQPL